MTLYRIDEYNKSMIHCEWESSPKFLIDQLKECYKKKKKRRWENGYVGQC